MSKHAEHLDQAFVARQRERLETLRAQIIEVSEDANRETRQLQDDNRAVPGDIADDAINLTQQEIDASLQVQESARLEEVERALEKIDEGSYGLSEISGDVIPRERLEAKPEALHTVEEEELREQIQGQRR
ncbi:MAG: TraR/DksA family transcriptional regulator [Pseudomonadales bacterium]